MSIDHCDCTTTSTSQLHGSTIRRAMHVIVKHEGVAGLYRGVGAVLAGTGYARD